MPADEEVGGNIIGGKGEEDKKDGDDQGLFLCKALIWKKAVLQEPQEAISPVQAEINKSLSAPVVIIEHEADDDRNEKNFMCIDDC